MAYDSYRVLTEPEMDASVRMLEQNLVEPDNVKTITSERLAHLLTIGEYIRDLCLVELEQRGELELHEGLFVMPYVGDVMVDTVLTRDNQSQNVN